MTEEVEILNISKFKRASYHAGIAYYIQSVKNAANLSIVNRIQQQMSIDPETAYQTEQVFPREVNNKENVGEAEEVNQQSQDDLNKLREMLQLIQTQQILASSGASISPQLDLNSLISNQIMFMQQSEVDQSVMNHFNSTPEVIKIATQKQLSDLLEVLNQNAEVNRKIHKERTKKDE